MLGRFRLYKLFFSLLICCIWPGHSLLASPDINAYKAVKVRFKHTLTPVEKTYYLILITEESITALDSVYSSISKLLSENEKLYEAGFLEETDVEQLKLNVKNTENSLISFKKQKEILYRLLKFQSGIDYNQNIGISGKLSDAVEEIEVNNLFAEDFNLNQNIDYPFAIASLTKLMTAIVTLIYLRMEQQHFIITNMYQFPLQPKGISGYLLNF